MKFHTTWLLSLCMFILLLPFNTQAATHESGLALTFDDDYVDQWYDYFITNNQRIDLSNVKATFFVSNFHLLSSSQLTKLRALANAGHEIGSHSYSHGEINTSDPTVNDPTKVSAYLNTQVLPTLTEMVAAGFTPLSFSYPSNGHTNAYDDAIRPYFPFLRAGYADGTRPLSQLDRLYHNSDKYYTFIEGDSIDSSGQNELPEIEAALTRAKNNTEILTLYTHRIQPDTQPHAYGLSVSKLNGVISKAKQLGLRFYTFSEAYAVGPAPNPQGQTGDPNNISISIESSSRVRVRWNSMPLNDYLGIVPVGSLYWAEGSLTNGEASGNLGINVPSVQAGQAYTAILYYNGNKVVTSAPFVIIPAPPLTQTLTINKTGTGLGTISSLPIGINCGTNCTENYTSGTSITLAANAATGSTFTGWSGAGCSGTQASCVVSMNMAQTVSANFMANTPPPPPSNASISTTIENTNRVRLNWSNMPPHDFLGIIPSTQANWQANMSGVKTDSSVAGKLGITVSEAVAGQTYTAIFYLNNIRVAASTPFIIIPGSTPSKQILTVSKIGTGTGTVSSSTTGINCGTDCTEDYVTGSSITLNATSDAGSTFSGWSGSSCSGTANCIVNMTTTQTVSANFTTSAPPPPSNATISVAIENTKRVRINWSNMPPHDFVGIVPINQSNWQSTMSGATTNSSVSGKIGITVSEAIAGQAYSAIFYLNNGRVAASAPFIIVP